ncbi:unnamed protein product [Paramecium primaurelia]|uniref:Transmembrane protein n=1 Tax=Paramecium primaurelia TaxID=5886 RepID=A0A8S1NL04_PARPR|nr:unnamed protein product [Paramecium primaurelia]
MYQILSKLFCLFKVKSILNSCKIITFPQKGQFVQNYKQLNKHEDFIINFDVYIERGGIKQSFFHLKIRQVNIKNELFLKCIVTIFILIKKQSSNVEFKVQKVVFQSFYRLVYVLIDILNNFLQNSLVLSLIILKKFLQNMRLEYRY